MGETEISWTHRPGTIGRTWNVCQGCSRKSEGCRHCYAERIAARFAAHGWSKGLIDPRTRKWNGTVRLALHRLHEPLAWRQPSTVFANSMSDMFHEKFTNEDILTIFGVMLHAQRHTFQILTKRAQRMANWFAWLDERSRMTGRSWSQLALEEAASMLQHAGQTVWSAELHEAARHPVLWSRSAPLPNVWLGVSVEDQGAADERIPALLETPSAVRFLSCEPLLGPVRLDDGENSWLTCCGPSAGDDEAGCCESRHVNGQCFRGISWVIVGCESGPGARPCGVTWLRSLRDQCAVAKVPFFLKQASKSGSEAVGGPLITLGVGSKRKAAGVVELPYLDGAQHAAFPEIASAP